MLSWFKPRTKDSAQKKTNEIKNTLANLEKKQAQLEKKAEDEREKAKSFLAKKDRNRKHHLSMNLTLSRCFVCPQKRKKV
jgi:AAA15 family ATPase/GTPase